jgi:hypothetical protein
MREAEKDKSTRFIITVDTETYAIKGSPPAFETNIYAHHPKGALGVSRIMDICDRRGVKATFFVDVYMHHHYGKERVKNLCREITEKGHDVQLHAHTSWLPGSRSGKLCDFPLQKQVDIIGEGKQLLEDWVGRAPVAFRAGAYTANLDTISALEKNGFLVDSSYFAFHRNCQLSRQLNNRYTNRPFQIGEIFEIPVTSYWLFRAPSYSKISKVDMNACSLSELHDIIPKLIRNKVTYITLFLHSFSFIRWKRDFSGVLPNYRALDRFEAILDSIARWGYQTSFCTMEEVPRIAQEKGTDFVPTLNSVGILSRALQRIRE